MGLGSRTGTAEWLKISKLALRRAEAAGQEHCLYCATMLNYRVSRQPDSAEPDHIVPYGRGGTDTLDNVQVICRHCNQSKGNKSTPITEPRVWRPLRTSRQW